MLQVFDARGFYKNPKYGHIRTEVTMVTQEDVTRVKSVGRKRPKPGVYFLKTYILNQNNSAKHAIYVFRL